MRRRPVLIVLGAAATVVAIGLLLPAVVRFGAHLGLAAVGFADTRGGDVSLGVGRARIAGIGIGRNGAATITVTYSARGLLDGRLDRIELSDAVLHGSVGANGSWTLGGYRTPQSTPASTNKPITLPAAEIRIENLSILLETPAGPVALSGAGVLAPAVGGLRLTGGLTTTRAPVDATTQIDFTLSTSGWTLTLDPVRLNLPGAAGKPQTIQGKAALSKSGDAPMAGSATFGADDVVVAGTRLSKVAANLTLTADGQTGSLQMIPVDGGVGIDGRLSNNAQGLAANIKVRFSDLGPPARALGWNTTSGPVQADLSLNAGPLPAGGGPRPVTLNLAYDGAAPSGIALHAGRLALSAMLDPATNSLALAGCGKLSVDAITIADLKIAKLSGCLGPAETEPAYSRDRTGRILLAGKFGDLSAAIQRGTATIAAITIPAFRASTLIGDGGLVGFDLGMDSGVIALPAAGASLRDIAVRARGAATDGNVTGSLSANFASLQPHGPGLVIAGALSGQMGRDIALALTASLPNEPPIVKAGIGNRTLRLDVEPTEIGDGSVGLLALTPGLTKTIRSLSGSVGLHAEADWSGARMTSRGKLILRDVAATLPNLGVQGVDAAIEMTSLRPLITAENQKLTMKNLLVGLPLSDGEITFGLDKRNVLAIADAHWHVAGGTVSTHDQQLDLYGPDQKLAVVVKGVDLAQLLALLKVPDLSAVGTLEGAIPLRHTGDTILVEHGILQTSGPGLLRYDPADVPAFLQGKPGEGTAILREALRDFHYDALSLAIDGVLGGEEQIKLGVRGANPKLYGGSPVSVNLNLSGALDSIARSSLESYTTPTETVRKHMQKTPGGKK